MSFLNKITQAIFGKTEKVEPLQSDEAQVMAMGRVLDGHPARKITPQKLQRIFDDAESGNVREQAELFMDIEEQDGAIGSHLGTRKRATLTLDWSIFAPENPTEHEEHLTSEVKQLFSQIGYLDNLVMDLMDACLQGFSANEIQWVYENELWLPKKFIHRPASWFVLDDLDNPLLISPTNPMGEPLIAQKWIVHTHKNRSSPLARNGLGRTLAWIYMFNHYSITDFAEFLELYGFPIRIGKYGAGASKDEKRALLRALSDIGHNAAGIMPDTMQIELHSAASQSIASNNPYLQMTDWAEKLSAKFILGQTLTSGADGKTSTNALGKVHNEVRRDLLVSDAKQLEQTINQQLILPFLQINFPNIDPARLPYFAFDVKEYEDIKTFSEALPNLIDSGMLIPLLWAHNKLGIPMAKEGEAVLKRAFNEVKSNESTALSAGLHQSHCPCGCQNMVALSAKEKAEGEQGELDSLIDHALQEVDFNQQLAPIVKKLTAVLLSCQSYEEVSDKLAEAYPNLTSEAHEYYLSSALFLADLLGASNAERT
ncbi:DUF935 domain-containing protein [Conservatibacter flavescens]|uniref:DUF935 domain-containing protein n=1 Tax=Conservatibacter flavescens TaxID=28161 RepID=A0A2M8S4X4_9PAST|nr:DUF935 domain-containing protein [Conservatibacter flavescens]PJG86206.1 DUF935 domain-containing protein [Conservatibacter flavescens]